jgi:putative membrane protein
MKHLARILALAGLALSVWLFLRADPKAIVTLLIHAGPGLALAGLIHVVPMALNARGWQALLPGKAQPSLVSMLHIVWVRESVNGLLPVARIGGEIVSFRLIRKVGVRRAPAAASLVVDMGLCVLCQVAFALLGVGLLAGYDRSDLLWQLSIGAAMMALIAMLFILIQHVGPFERLMLAINRLAAGKLDDLVGHSMRIDRAVRAMYRRRGVVLRSLIWQFCGCVAVAAEIWVALWLLGSPVGPGKALTIEAVIMAASSAGFLIPGAIGIQEGTFLIVCSVLGLSPATALALAAARRLRDCVVFFPGLWAWQLSESQSNAPTAVPASK